MMRYFLNLVTALALTLSNFATSGANLALPLVAGAVLAGLPTVSEAKPKKKAHHKGAKHKKHNKNRSQRNTKKVVADRDVDIDRDVDVDVDVDDDDDGSFVGGLVVGGITATIINEASQE